MEEQFRKIIESIGEDPNREGLRETPARAARAALERGDARDGWKSRIPGDRRRTFRRLSGE